VTPVRANTFPTALLLLSTLALGPPAWAQDAPAADAEADAEEASSGSQRTPRAAVQTFLVAAREGRLEDAAAVLDLREIRRAQRAERGPILARRLKAVLDRRLWIELEEVSAEPDGLRERLGSIEGRTGEVPIVLVRVRRDGDAVWVFSRSTVAAIPGLYAMHGPSWIEAALPAGAHVRLWEMELWQWLGLVLVFLVAGVGGALLARLTLHLGGRVAQRTESAWDDDLTESLRGPARFVVAVLLATLLLPALALAAPAEEAVNSVLSTAFLAAAAWSAVRAIGFVARRVEENAKRRVERGEMTDLALRGLRTQVVVLRRIASIVVGVVAVALILVQFEVVRTVGVSLLASAGIAGVVLGLAAQRSIATLLAGLQLSITQPLRMGDTVIVEGEWGQIEEIHLTYVVVKIWDERRLVVPMNRFLEQSFQNWTKVSPQLLGTVFVHADYTLPVDLLREELDRILEGNPKWDGRAKGVVVTDAKAQTLEVRALVSTRDASDGWDLRCEVRERLVAFLREHEGGRYLPRVRVEGEEEAAGGAVPIGR
jgi:small-conductance mechanosensitive channel